MFLQFVHLMKKTPTQETERDKIMWGPGNPFSLEQVLVSAFLRSLRGCGHSWLRDLYWFKEEGWTVQMISVPLYQLAHRAHRDSIGIFNKGSEYFVYLHSYSYRMHIQTWHATYSLCLLGLSNNDPWAGCMSSSTFWPTSSSPVKALKVLQEWQDLISTSCYIIASNLKSLEIFLAAMWVSMVITIYPPVSDDYFLYDIQDRGIVHLRTPSPQALT